MNTRIAKDELAQWLGISTRSIFWEQPAIKSARFGASNNYDCDKIDMLFASCNHNLPTPLTVADLAYGAVVLVTTPEAQKTLNASEPYVKRNLHSGKLRYIKLPGVRSFLITQASVDQFMYVRELKSKQPTSAAKNKVLAHIFGLTSSTITMMMTSGELEVVPESHPYRVRPDSVLRCLTARLPSWVTADEWLKERLATDEALLTLEDVSIQLGGRENVFEAIKQQSLRYITRHHNGYGFSPKSVAEYLACEEPLDIATIAILYDANATTVKNWRARGKLKCHIHGHSPKRLTKSCFLAMLRETFTTTASPKRWYDIQLAKKHRLHTFAQAVKYLGISANTLNEFVEHKRLSYIRLPNGEVKFAYTVLTNFKAKCLAKR
ncbi:MAG TPA: hypothetical protein VLG40_04190 [Candidatus Saccharimonas sp.]|nr:hypothetical protein [Candidatus Saccharimonas sp.]